VHPRLCLAATCHDPAGGFATGIDRASGLWDHVDAVAVNATDETDPGVLAALERKVPGALQSRHRAGSVGIGLARLRSLELALETDCTHVVYSDLDHVLRWSAVDASELRSALAPGDDDDLVVLGRSAAAFEREPARLRLTESGVNAAASLAAGFAERVDFMFAVRLMTRACAAELVARCAEETIGSDVAWPLHAKAAGMRLGFRHADGLGYRHRDDFDADSDARDADPAEWVRRIRIAALHAQAMVPYLGP
jgi:hypothetical protein